MGRQVLSSYTMPQLHSAAPNNAAQSAPAVSAQISAQEASQAANKAFIERFYDAEPIQSEQ